MGTRTVPGVEQLAALIKANPGCEVVIDNDCWWLYSKPRAEQTEDEQDADACLIARDGQFAITSVGYVRDCTYGGGVLLALAHLAGVKVESV